MSDSRISRDNVSPVATRTRQKTTNIEASQSSSQTSFSEHEQATTSQSPVKRKRRHSSRSSRSTNIEASQSSSQTSLSEKEQKRMRLPQRPRTLKKKNQPGSRSSHSQFKAPSFKKPRKRSSSSSSSQKLSSSSQMSKMGTRSCPGIFQFNRTIPDWKAQKPELYDLSSIIPNFTEEKKKHRKRMRKSTDAHYVYYSVIRSWLEQNFKCQESGYDVLIDTAVEPFKALGRLFVSEDIRPDLMIYSNSVPVLAIEVHSSPYSETLLKLVYVLVAQLRYFKNCDASIDKVQGFAFPKYGELTCVCRVSVSWKVFKFVIDYDTLSSDIVSRSILEVLDKQSQFSSSTCHGPYFAIKLNNADLMELNKEMCNEQEPRLSQVYSRTSVILQGNDFFYKYISDEMEKSNILILSQRATNDQNPKPRRYLLPSGFCQIRKASFFKYPKLLPPLTREEARNCLPSFIKSVAQAIMDLHSELEVAHLDIRLENICFSEEKEAVLIDLDRNYCKISHPRHLQYQSGVMYNVSEMHWTCEMLDWRQLAYVVVFCIAEETDDYHAMKVPDTLRQDIFIKELLKGSCNLDFLEKSTIIKGGLSSKKLHQVLADRER